MASPKIPLVKKISNEVFTTIQKAMTPAQRDGLASHDWVRISGECDQFALKVAGTIEAPDSGGDDD